MIVDHAAKTRMRTLSETEPNDTSLNALRVTAQEDSLGQSQAPIFVE